VAESSIIGVAVKDLKLLPSDRGRLMEIQRGDEQDFPGFGQAYVTSTYPGVIKAWYRHATQVDQIAVVTGLLKLVLYDDRPESPSHGTVQEIVIGDLAPRLVRIPPGIWHGFQAIGGREAFALHLNTVPYDAARPDEERLPPDTDEIPYRW
jgi:dTDP-4-dehydrorhamnose 3,5-epimerase